MNNIVNITEFRNNISEYLNRVIYKNESILLRKGKSIVAKVIYYNMNKEFKNKKDKILSLMGLWTNTELKTVKAALNKINLKSKKDIKRLLESE